MKVEELQELAKLLRTAKILRGPGGCPWDAEQSHQSLVPYLLEETYELIEAIEAGNREDVIEELGDVLYQVIFHCDMTASGSLGEPFDLEDVARVSDQKMRGRHPHVFGTPEELEKYAANTGEEVMINWDSHKQREKPHRESVLDGIPQAMPALALASKVLGKAEKIGLLDPNSVGAVQVANEGELGKLLLAIVASAKSAGFDSERALREATRELQVEIRQAELDSDLDAGIVGQYKNEIG